MRVKLTFFSVYIDKKPANFILFEQNSKFWMSILISTLYSLEKVNIIIHMQFCFTYNLRNSQIVLGQVYALSGILY